MSPDHRRSLLERRSAGAPPARSSTVITIMPRAKARSIPVIPMLPIIVLSRRRPARPPPCKDGGAPDASEPVADARANDQGIESRLRDNHAAVEPRLGVQEDLLDVRLKAPSPLRRQFRPEPLAQAVHRTLQPLFAMGKADSQMALPRLAEGDAWGDRDAVVHHQLAGEIEAVRDALDADEGIEGPVGRRVTDAVHPRQRLADEDPSLHAVGMER